MNLQNNGERNVIQVSDDLVGTLNIVVNGNDNIVRIGARCRSNNLRIDVRANHGLIEVGDACVLAGEFTLRDHRTQLRVGERTTMMGTKITMHEAGCISIGEDCMFAGEVRMDTSDMHSILDASTGERLNPPADIEIETHVWIGFGVYLLKGIRIGSNSVIGAQSVVARDIPPNSVAVGVPARVVRSGVTWDRRRLAVGPGTKAQRESGAKVPELESMRLDWMGRAAQWLRRGRT
jgi:acetyltransferase-like isoleucine patch superfamily enzyme